MAEQPKSAVYVTNISPSATEKTVSDFFSFCGKITKLYLKKEETEGTSSAVVQFETEAAGTTPSSTSPSTETSSESPSEPIPSDLGAQVAPENITQRDFGGVADEERSKTSVIASMLAAGYVLGSDVLHKAKDYDEKHNLSLQAKVALETIKVKANEIDKQYGISEKAVAAKTAAVEKAKKLDEEYHISEKASTAANTVKTTVVATSQKVQENPTVKSGMESLKTGLQKASDAMSQMYNDYKEQTEKAIEEKKKERAAKQPQLLEGGAVAPSEDSSPAPDDAASSTPAPDSQPATTNP